jgi:hypothetical protein
MKFFLLSLILLTFSCQEEKKTKIKLERPQYLLQSFTIPNKNHRDTFVAKDSNYLHNKHLYTLDKELVDAWFERIKNIDSFKQATDYTSFATLGLVPKLISIETVDKTKIQLEGYLNNSQGFIKVQYFENKKFSRGEAFYVSETDFKSLFPMTNDLRYKNLQLESMSKVQYESNKKLINLDPDDALVVFEILKTIIFEDYPYSGKVDENVLNKYKFSFRENNNITGMIRVKAPQKTLELVFAKPKPRDNIALIYIKGRQEIYQARLSGWLKLTRILQRFH